MARRENQTALTVEKPLIADIDRIAKVKGLSRAGLVRYVMRMYCEDFDRRHQHQYQKETASHHDND